MIRVEIEYLDGRWVARAGCEDGYSGTVTANDPTAAAILALAKIDKRAERPA